MLTKSIIRVSAFLGILFGASLVARADVLVDTFAGPGNGVDNFGWSNPSSTYMFRPFTVTGTYKLDSISAAVALVGGTAPTEDLDFILYADNGGVPGAALETFRETIDRTATIHTVTSLTHPTLTTGTYHVAIGRGSFQWVWLSPADLSTSNWGSGSPTDGWDLNNAQLRDLTLRVNATPVPEPASLLVLGLGTAVVIRRRKK